MWGFTILFLTIIEAYGDLFHEDLPHPRVRAHREWIGFIEDFFAVAVLLALIVFTIIRIKNAPARKDRKSRFYGSHTGAAWLVLAMIAGGDHHPAPVPGGPDQHRGLPLRLVGLRLPWHRPRRCTRSGRG